MKPYINDTTFGSITVDGKAIEHDIIIRLSGEIIKRKKKLSKSAYGTSHIISPEEAKFVYENGTQCVIIGSGQNGLVTLAEEANDYLKKKKCKVDILPTPMAILQWNKAKGPVLGIFHITC